jgi:hypothetical protein
MAAPVADNRSYGDRVGRHLSENSAAWNVIDALARPPNIASCTKA